MPTRLYNPTTSVRPPSFARASNKPLIAYLGQPTTYQYTLPQFEFVPNESFRHFWFFFSNAHEVDRSHALQHSWFCKNYSCPFHHPYGS
jgi:hypothetical protein